MLKSETPVKTPTRVSPSVAPRIEPMRRYSPREDECEQQWRRLVTRIRP